jgi:hypothetical protein
MRMNVQIPMVQARREYRFIGRNGHTTRWRKMADVLRHPKKSTRAKLGEGYGVEMRTRKSKSKSE